jgi:pimeloyl-ACP methyl ester carboxylesterase
VKLSPPRVRRCYFETRHGQLHVHTAIPAGGGFGEDTPLLCVHGSPLSGGMFTRFLPLIGRDRSVYAPDLPGFGNSDAAAATLTITSLATFLGEFLHDLRLRHIDVLGYGAGAFIAAELALAAPQQVRRVVLVSGPLCAPADTAAETPCSPIAADADAQHLAQRWHSLATACGPHASPAWVTTTLVGLLRAGAHPQELANAVRQHATPDRLPLITQPVLWLEPDTGPAAAPTPIREMLPTARHIKLAAVGPDLFDSNPEQVCDTVQEFLRPQP